MSLNTPYWSDEYETWMRIAPNNTLQRLKTTVSTIPSGDITVGGASKPDEPEQGDRWERWIPVSSEDYIKNSKDYTFATKQDRIKSLMRSINAQIAKNPRDSIIWNDPETQANLKNLTSLELKEAKKALDGTPYTHRSKYRENLYKYIQERTELLEDTYPHSFYDTDLGDSIRVTNSRPLKINGAEENIANEMVIVRHPTAGRIKFLKNNGNWEVFDGLDNVAGEIFPNNEKSKFLQEVQFAPHIEKIISLLEKHNDDIEFDDTRIFDVFPVDSFSRTLLNVDRFNAKYNDTPYMANTNWSDVAQNTKNWNKLRELAESALESKVDKGLSPEIETLRNNPKLAAGIFSNIDHLASEGTDISDFILSTLENNGLSLGHPTLNTSPTSVLSVVTAIDDRGDYKDPHPITDYPRPTTRNGSLVPYQAMTSDEKEDFRNHFEDLYDRPKAWLTHTAEGRSLYGDTYDRTVDRLNSEGAWQEYHQQTLESDSIQNEEGVYVPLSTYLNVGGTLKDENGIRNVGKTLSELVGLFETGSNEDVEDITEMERLIIDTVMSGGSRKNSLRLALGIGDEEALKEDIYKLETDNELLGTPIVPNGTEWATWFKRGSNPEEIIVGGTPIPVDELYKSRTGGLLNINLAEDGHYELNLTDTETNKTSPVESFSNAGFAGKFQENDGGTFKNQQILSLDDHLDSSVIEQFVFDGVLPRDYAPDVEVREEAPENPEMDSEDHRLNLTLISDALRTYRALRGFDSEEGIYKFEIGPDPETELLRFNKNGKPQSIVSHIYESLNKAHGRQDKPKYFYINKTEYESEDFNRYKETGEMPPETPTSAAGGDGSKEPPKGRPTTESVGDPDDSEEASEKTYSGLTPEQEALRQASINLTRSNFARSTGKTDDARTFDNRASTASSNAINYQDAAKELEDTYGTAFLSYQQDRQIFDVLGNAPLDVRATAYRYRIEGLERSLDEAQTMGEAYDIARQWMRAGVVEFSDMIEIDRDGTSKFRNLRDKLGAAGVDWYEVNQEWEEHGKTVQDRTEAINSIQEQIDFLNQRFPTAEEGNEESQRAQEIKEAFIREQTNLRNNDVPTFGSLEHVEQLKNDPDRNAVYKERHETAIAQPNRLSGTLRGTANSVGRSLVAGLTAYREMRAVGVSRLGSFIHSAMATIGEGTGIGADRIRGLDLTKPLEQIRVGFEDSPKRSYLNVSIPGTNIGLPFGRRDTVYERNKKDANREGKYYRPPQTRTPEQSEAIERMRQMGQTPTSEWVGEATQDKVTTSADPDPYTDPTPQRGTPQPKPNLEENQV